MTLCSRMDWLSIGIDLLEKLLRFDYRERPTAEDALAHAFLAKYHDPEYEPTAPPIVDIHEKAQYSAERWEGELFDRRIL